MKTNRSISIRSQNGVNNIDFLLEPNAYTGMLYARNVAAGQAPVKVLSGTGGRQLYGTEAPYEKLFNITSVLTNLPDRTMIPDGGGVIDYVSSRVMSLVNSGTATYYLASNGRYIIRQHYDNSTSYVRLFNGTSGVGSANFKYLDITVWQYSSSFYVRGFGINSNGTLEAIQFTASVGNPPNVSTGGSVPIYTYKTM